MKKDRYITVALDNATYNALEKQANKQDRTKAYLIRKIIIEKLKREGEQIK